jgi:hypothetical protein
MRRTQKYKFDSLFDSHAQILTEFDHGSSGYLFHLWTASSNYVAEICLIGNIRCGRPVVRAGRQGTGFQIPFPPLLLNNIFGAKDYIIYGCELHILKGTKMVLL